MPATAAAATPADARGFVESIGVNVHLYYTDTANDDFPMLKQRLQELGIRHIRDRFDPLRRGFFFDRVNSLGAAGIRSTLIACAFEPQLGEWSDYVEDAKQKVRGSLDALEGVNEPDRYQGGVSDWADRAKSCQYWLYRHARGERYGAPLNVPILGPSVAPHRAEEFGDVSALGNPGATVANFHPYAGARAPSGPDYYPFPEQKADVLTGMFPGRSVPIQATETGYHDSVNCTCSHNPASQRAIAIYLPRLLMEHARGGVQRTFLYELVDLRPDPERDDVESNFGLFENDWSYKPSAEALKNLIGFLDSPSASTRKPLGYTLTNTGDPDGPGTGGAVKHRLFQKADGSWWLALWQDSSVWDVNDRRDISNPTVKVGVQLDRTLTATGYRPTRGTGTHGSVRASSFTAGVGDDVLLVRLTD